MPGPAPKKASERRRRNIPESQGEAADITVETNSEQPDLGFMAHQMVQDMWSTLGESLEAKFYSSADWQRARWELWFANQILSGAEPVTAASWSMIQSGLSALLVSPADKRKAGIELKRVTSDPDEDAAVADLAEFRSRVSG